MTLGVILNKLSEFNTAKSSEPFLTILHNCKTIYRDIEI